jgi:hypothetical protein
MKGTDDMDRTVSSVMRRDMSLRGAADPFQIPYSILKNKTNITKTPNALRNEIEIKSAGHPAVCSMGMNQIWLPG